VIDPVTRPGRTHPEAAAFAFAGREIPLIIPSRLFAPEPCAATPAGAGGMRVFTE